MGKKGVLGGAKKLEQEDWFALIVQTDPSFNTIAPSDIKQPNQNLVSPGINMSDLITSWQL